MCKSQSTSSKKRFVLFSFFKKVDIWIVGKLKDDGQNLFMVDDKLL